MKVLELTSLEKVKALLFLIFLSPALILVNLWPERKTKGDGLNEYR